jgi:hypothetical protein
MNPKELRTRLVIVAITIVVVVSTLSGAVGTIERVSASQDRVSLTNPDTPTEELEAVGDEPMDTEPRISSLNVYSGISTDGSDVTGESIFDDVDTITVEAAWNFASQEGVEIIIRDKYGLEVQRRLAADGPKQLTTSGSSLVLRGVDELPTGTYRVTVRGTDEFRSVSRTVRFTIQYEDQTISLDRDGSGQTSEVVARITGTPGEHGLVKIGERDLDDPDATDAASERVFSSTTDVMDRAGTRTLGGTDDQYVGAFVELGNDGEAEIRIDATELDSPNTKIEFTERYDAEPSLTTSEKQELFEQEPDASQNTAFSAPTVFLGEESVDLQELTGVAASSDVPLTLIGTAGEGSGSKVTIDNVASADVSNTNGFRAGTAYNASDNQDGYSVLQVVKPQISDVTLHAGSSTTGPVVTGGSIRSNQDRITIESEWNFVNTENVAITIKDEAGREVQSQLTGSEVLTSSGDSVVFSGISELNEGTYTVTVEGRGDLTEVNSSVVFSIQDTETALARTPTAGPRGTDVVLRLTGTPNKFGLVKIDAEQLRSDPTNETARRTFLTAGDLQYAAGVNRVYGGSTPTIDNDWIFGVVAFNEQGVANIRVNTETLSIGASDVQFNELDSSTQPRASSETVASGLNTSATGSVRLTINERQISITSAPNSVSLYEEFTIEGAARQSEHVKAYIRTDEEWVPLVDERGDFSESDVVDDGRWSVDIRVGGYAISNPGDYRIALIADPVDDVGTDYLAKPTTVDPETYEEFDTKTTTAINITSSNSNNLVVDSSQPNAYDTIQAAVDAAAPGERVEVRPGTYHETVDVYKTINLVAPEGAILNGSTVDGPDAIELPSGSSISPTISGFTITGYDDDGVDATETTGSWVIRDVTVREVGGSGLDSDHSTGDWFVDGITIENTSDYAMDVHRTTGEWRATNIRVEGSSGGVWASNTSGEWQLINSKIIGTDIDAILVQNSTGNWQIEGTSLQNNGDDGIDVSFATGDWGVRSSVISQNEGTGIEAEKTSGEWIVRDTVIKDNRYDGIYMESSTDGWKVSTTRIKNNSGDGVDTSYSTGPWTIQESEVTNNSDTGIDGFNSTGNWEITDTQIANNSDRGVDAFSTTGDWKIQDSTISGTDGDISLINNSGRDLVQIDGVGVLAANSTGDWSIKSTTIDRNQEAIGAYGSEGNWTVQDTTIQSNIYVGILANISTGNWTVRDSSIINHSNSGIFARYSSGAWVIKNSTIKRNGGNVTYVDSTTGEKQPLQSHAVDAIGTSGPWRIQGVSFINNSGDGSNAVNATRAALEGDAQQNWWGQPTGPTDGQCVGNVSCGEWLAAPGGDTVTKPDIHKSSLDINPFPVPTGDAPRVSIVIEDATDAYLDVTVNEETVRVPMEPESPRPFTWVADLSRVDNPDIDNLERGTKVELSVVACNKVCTTNAATVFNRTKPAFPQTELPTNDQNGAFRPEHSAKSDLHYFVFEQVVEVPVALVDFQGESHTYDDKDALREWKESREYDLNSYFGSERGARGSIGFDLVYYDNESELFQVKNRSTYEPENVDALLEDGEKAAFEQAPDKYIVAHPGDNITNAQVRYPGCDFKVRFNPFGPDCEDATAEAAMYVAMKGSFGHYGTWVHELGHLSLGMGDLYPDGSVQGGIKKPVMAGAVGTPANSTSKGFLPAPFSVVSRLPYNDLGSTKSDDENWPWATASETTLPISGERSATVRVKRVDRIDIGDDVPVINVVPESNFQSQEIKYVFAVYPIDKSVHGFEVGFENGRMRSVAPIGPQDQLFRGQKSYLGEGIFVRFSVTKHEDDVGRQASVTATYVTESANHRVFSVQPKSVGESSTTNGSPVPTQTLADIDLRAVDNQGRVTGVTEDGKFVNEIPGAEASGDRVQGPEWISVPSEADVEVKVSTTDAQQFVNETNVSAENATISYTTEVTEVGENPQLVTENGTVTVTNTTTTTTNETAEPGETKQVSTGFSVAQFDRDDDNQIGFDDLRFALREFNNGNITFDQLRRILRAYNTGEPV